MELSSSNKIIDKNMNDQKQNFEEQVRISKIILRDLKRRPIKINQQNIKILQLYSPNKNKRKQEPILLFNRDNKILMEHKQLITEKIIPDKRRFFHNEQTTFEKIYRRPFMSEKWKSKINRKLKRQQK